MILPLLALILTQSATQQAATELERQQAAQQRQQAALTEQLRLENDRLNRVQVQQRLDALALQYRSATPAERAALLQQMQEQQTTLRSIAQHERLSETELQVEVERLRTNLDKARAAGLLSAPAIQRRQIEIQSREEELARIRSERQQIAGAHQPPQGDVPPGTARAVSVPAGGIGGLAVNELDTRRILLRQGLPPIAVTEDPSRGVIVTLPGTLFATGTAKLTEAAGPTLDRIAVALKAQPAIVVRVEGYTDDRGRADTNLRFSELRAVAVRDYLVGAGLGGGQITAVGKGGAESIASNTTPAGRERNQRVEIVIEREKPAPR
jgi:outer membrane protein OmpA-like peptidoglycan-associated protein